jgi:hypothetical protein
MENECRKWIVNFNKINPDVWQDGNYQEALVTNDEFGHSHWNFLQQQYSGNCKL